MTSDDVLPKINNRNTIETDTISTMNQKPKILNTEPTINTLGQKDFSSSLYNPMKTLNNKRRFKKPEEELAELEAEFEKEEKLIKRILKDWILQRKVMNGVQLLNIIDNYMKSK